MPHLLLLTAYPQLYTPRRLAAAAAELGWRVSIVGPTAWTGSDDPSGRIDTSVEAPAAERPRLLTRPGPFTLLGLLRRHRELVRAGAYPLQTRRELLHASDKSRTWRLLSAAGVAVPPTRIVRTPGPAMLDGIPGPPWFVKGRRGSQGSHVLLAESRSQAFAQGMLLWGTGSSFLVQQDLRSRGRVERHLIARGNLVASAIALPAPGEHRSNAHRGGRFEPLPPGSEAATAAHLALAAVAALGLPYAAVDTIGQHDPAVLEVNASPGLEALERATGRDLAREVMTRLLAAH